MISLELVLIYTNVSVGFISAYIALLSMYNINVLSPLGRHSVCYPGFLAQSNEEK